MKIKKAGMYADLLLFGGAEGEISRASIIMHPLPFSLSPRGRGAGVRGGYKWGQPPRELPRGMREILSLKLPWFDPPQQKKIRADRLVNPFLFLGGAEGDRTPDPKTAREKRQKNTTLDITPGFPF